MKKSLLIPALALTSLVLGCASTRVVLAPVGPNPSRVATADASGQLQVFEGLVFHGGEGSTLEMRCFSEAGLRESLLAAGFEYIRIYAEDYPEYGVVHDESWSLPIAARRRAPGNREVFQELARRYQEAQDQRRWAVHTQEEMAKIQEAVALERQRLQNELMEKTEWARGLEADLEARTHWAKGLETQSDERTRWAISLEADLKKARERLSELEGLMEQRTRWAQQLDQQVDALEGELKRARGGAWHRVGRLLRLAR